MITLVNIVKQNDTVTVNYYAENRKDDMGFIKYNIKSDSVLEYLYSKDDAEYVNRPGFSKAIKAIKELIKYGKFPAKYHYMWY